jgi:alkylation response protein AidB-like acyl-CoA dehydrogenase
VVAVALDGVRVDGDRRLGAAGTVAAGLRRALDVAAAAFAMEAVGTCTAIFELALEYAKDREQFGVKIGSFQAMKHKFADMYVALEAARATCYFAAVALAEDDPRRSIGASMAKGLAGDACRRIGQEGIQSLGGIGYTWEHDMQLYVKRVLSAPALLGTVDEHRERVAALLGVVPG